MARKKTPKTQRVHLYDLVSEKGSPRQNNPYDDLLREEAMSLASEARRLGLEQLILNRKMKIEQTKQGSTILGGENSNQLLQLVQMMNSQLTQGIQLATSGNQSETIKPLEYLRLAKELLLSDQKSHNQPSFFDNFLKLRELGMISSSSATDQNQFSVQIERLRGERDLQNRKYDLELQKSRLQHDQRARMLETLISSFVPMLNLASNSLAQESKNLGRNLVERVGNPVAHNPGPDPETATIDISCRCGYQNALLVPVPVPEKITCPGCGTVLNVGETPPPDSETADAWRDTAGIGGKP